MMQKEFDKYIQDTATFERVASAADLPHELSRQGDPVAAYEGRRLHSFVNPVGEALDWLEQNKNRIQSSIEGNGNCSIVILGAGLGYCIGALERYLQERQIDPNGVEIRCVEACPEIARKALMLRIWEPSTLKVIFHVIDESSTIKHLGVESHSIALTGGAGYQLRKEIYENFLHKDSNDAVNAGNLRVLVPTPLYGGSLPAALHSAEALRELGYDVELMDLSKYYDGYQSVEDITGKEKHRRSLQGLYASFLAECIVARAIEWKADVVWAVAQTPLTPPALRELRHLGIRTAFWFVEDWKLFEYWKEVSPDYDAVFTIQKGEFHKQLREHGAGHVAYLPCAANPETHYPQDLSATDQNRYGSKCSFVGAGYYNRQHVFSSLSKDNFKIWGSDWPQEMIESGIVMEKGRRVSTDETRKIFNASEINLNLHSSAYYQDLDAEGDFVNPRTFEIAACGAFQIVDERLLLSEQFDTDEMVTFRTIEEMKARIEQFESDSTLRKQYAEKARARVLKEHTYRHRLESAMKYMMRAFPDLKEKATVSFVDSLLNAVPQDEEMKTYLNQLDRSTAKDLDSIVSSIQLGKGKLSRPEGILLLMKEFRDWGVEKGVIS